MCRAHKDALYEQLARLGKAMSAPRRLELLDLLGQAPRTVEALAELTGMSEANTSQHLQVLRAAGLLESRKEGLYVTYSLAGDDVGELFRALRSVAESRLAEMERVSASSSPDRRPRSRFRKRAARAVRRGEAVLLILPRRVAQTHPVRSGPARGSQRRPPSCRSREIVAYCRGPYCVLAIEAVKTPRGRGFKAALAKMASPVEGAGLPVEVPRGGTMIFKPFYYFGFGLWPTSSAAAASAWAPSSIRRSVTHNYVAFAQSKAPPRA